MKTLAAAVVVLMLLAGCSEPPPKSTETPASPGGLGKHDNVFVTKVNVDGRQVTCIAWDSDSYSGGLSCDWANAKPATDTK